MKTTSYAENARALAIAHDKGCSEAIFSNTLGNLCEGTGSNVFFGRAGVLYTTPLSSGCLAGTARDLLLDLGLAKEADLPMSEFGPRSIDEAFLASSIRGVQPIQQIDDEIFGAVLRTCSTTQAARALCQLVGLRYLDP